MTADDILFRCSSLGYIMTEPREQKQRQRLADGDFHSLSEGTKTHLVDLFVSAYYKRRQDIQSKFIEKGNAREEDSITLLSRVFKTFYKKNAVRLNNAFITGEPDLFKGVEIQSAEETLDIKSSWSANTFFRSIYSPLDSGYEWQGHGYMMLTGAKKHTVAYCLVNSTVELIDDEKRRALYKLGETPEYIERCQEIERNHIYDMAEFRKEYPFYQLDSVDWSFDIPMQKRVFLFEFYRDEEKTNRILTRIELCREYMYHTFFKHAT